VGIAKAHELSERAWDEIVAERCTQAQNNTPEDRHARQQAIEEGKRRMKEMRKENCRENGRITFDPSTE
jgi:hypothetical protein